MQVKVTNKQTSEIFEINGTVNQVKREAKCRFNQKHEDMAIDVEIIGGIGSSVVALNVKAITKRRLTAEEVNQYAQEFGLEVVYSRNFSKTYFWSEAMVNKLKEKLQNEN